MCADFHYNDNKPATICDHCGADLDAEGQPIGEQCNYSQDVCPVCGDAPCGQYC